MVLQSCADLARARAHTLTAFHHHDPDWLTQGAQVLLSLISSALWLLMLNTSQKKQHSVTPCIGSLKLDSQLGSLLRTISRTKASHQEYDLQFSLPFPQCHKTPGWALIKCPTTSWAIKRLTDSY
ncbi:hypothetical protein PM082_002147 [Marasmius tenuissimus]|nr:hypothetical protein PM082_002147 [Marasmius tenuissimus]